LVTIVPPQLASANALYSYLKIGPGERKFLQARVGARYTIRKIPKRSGGFRQLLVPQDRLKYQQRLILELLYPLFVRRKPVHGFAKGYDAISNANEHQGRPYLLNIDLEDFFPSINRARVLGVFRKLGLPLDTAQALATLCVPPNELPQGAPTSPLISNMICFGMDAALMRFAASNHMRYTRYADDITFSSFKVPHGLFDDPEAAPGKIYTPQLSHHLRAIIEENGFSINEKKSWYSDKRSRREVTGLVVNRFTNVKRTYVRNIRASLYAIETKGLAAAQSDFSTKYNTTKQLERVLNGRLHHLAHVRGTDFSAYRTLASRYNKIFPNSKLYVPPAIDEILSKAIWILEVEIDHKGKSYFGQGTAVFVQGAGLITADHVLGELPPGLPVKIMCAKSGDTFFATPTTRRCPHTDLCVLDHSIPVGRYLELKPSDGTDKELDQIRAYGFPNYEAGNGLTVREGNIEAFQISSGVKRVQVSCWLSDGMSGGPVLNSRFQVIGLTHRGGEVGVKNVATLVSEISKL
jgi:RNA-directed DNA polymerase